MTTRGKFRYLFGPVPSRRLGNSLGIDVVPRKTCTYNCIYCQLGPTSFQTLTREEYVPVEKVMAELIAFLAENGRADYLTFSGSGEPTLHSKLGDMIAQTKQLTRIPVAVLTCGALLSDPHVRADLAQADVVLPSLDAALPKTFHALNRPHGKLHLSEVIAGLKKFREEYRGQIWLEIMFVKGLNDGAEEIALLREAIAEIAPDKVQLNTVTRPPAESEARALSEAELQVLQATLGPPTEVIAAESRQSSHAVDQDLVPQLLAMLAQHPLTLTEIGEYLQCKHEIIWWLLHALIEEGVVEVRPHLGKKFYVAPAVASK
ncbi:MAG: radical SAM protein [candidate division KSB1 bacterium]